MINSQVKAMLRNKSNRKYIFVLFIMFIFLNIGINLSDLIDSYFDLKLREIADDATIESLKEINLRSYVEVNEDGIAYKFTLTNEQQEEIKKIKYVVDFKSGTWEFLGTTYNIYKIYVDDWKHIDYVKNVLDKQGIDTNEVGGSLTIQLFVQNYANVQTIANVIKYAVIIITIVIIFIIYKNLIKNQENDLKLLSVLGFKPRQIRKIKLVNLLTITAISWLIGIIILVILFSIFVVVLGKMEINLLENVIINVIVYAIILLLATLIKNKKNI